MYRPPIYNNSNIEEIEAFLHKYSFGILVSASNNQLSGTHIPFALELNETGKKVLRGHISKANSQKSAFHNQEKVMVIFQGPHVYISPSWYDHVNVPTWNYIAVHVYGKIKVLEGQELYDSMRKMVDKYEMKSAKPISFETMGADYIDKEMKGIVGFEIEIENFEAAYKLSQNRDEKNIKNIILELEKLEEQSAKAIANEMKKLKS